MLKVDTYKLKERIDLKEEYDQVTVVESLTSGMSSHYQKNMGRCYELLEEKDYSATQNRLLWLGCC